MKRLTIHVLTLFPEFIRQYAGYGIVRRAVEQGLIDISPVHIREYAGDSYGTVDDTPYGGGAGMVMKPDVLARSLHSIEDGGSDTGPVILLTPQGRTLTQSIANELSLQKALTLVCGRYRGIDERFRKRYVTDEISIGDYVISGGEPAAAVLIDSVARLVPGAMGDFESGIDDSFQDGLLDCPWYTRPVEFEGLRVPDVLLSGDHKKIKQWRAQQSLKRTRERRPDLME